MKIKLQNMFNILNQSEMSDLIYDTLGYRLPEHMLTKYYIALNYNGSKHVQAELYLRDLSKDSTYFHVANSQIKNYDVGSNGYYSLTQTEKFVTEKSPVLAILKTTSSSMNYSKNNRTYYFSL